MNRTVGAGFFLLMAVVSNLLMWVWFDHPYLWWSAMCATVACLYCVFPFGPPEVPIKTAAWRALRAVLVAQVVGWGGLGGAALLGGVE